MAKLVISLSFVVAFAVYLAIKFVAHHAKTGIAEAKKAADAVDIRALTPAIDEEDISSDTQ